MSQLACILLIAMYFYFQKEKLLLNCGSYLGMVSHHFYFPLFSSEEKDLWRVLSVNSPNPVCD